MDATLTHPGPLLSPDLAGQASSNRRLAAPVDLERSRRVVSTPRQCPYCWGPWVRELPGGPVVRHTPDCAILP